MLFLDINKGFVIKKGAHGITVVGNEVTVLTTTQDLLVNESYEVSIFMPLKKT
jgi:hypothetical protein